MFKDIMTNLTRDKVDACCSIQTISHNESSGVIISHIMMKEGHNTTLPPPPYCSPPLPKAKVRDLNPPIKRLQANLFNSRVARLLVGMTKVSALLRKVLE